jgi:5-formyltetrahydrofolate cyclo-ligase
MVHSPSPEQLRDEKSALRRLMAERREALPAGRRAQLCQDAARRLAALPAFAAPETKIIAGFVAIRNEIDPAAALAAAQARGATVVLPRVTGGRPRLRFHHAGPAPLETGRFGLSEPPASAPEVSAADIDLMVVPGLAFDLTGRRLGYGGGYYDESAADAGGQEGARRPLRVAFAYDFQIVATCPAGDGDVGVDWIVTDQRAVACGGPS